MDHVLNEEISISLLAFLSPLCTWLLLNCITVCCFLLYYSKIFFLSVQYSAFLPPILLVAIISRVVRYASWMKQAFYHQEVLSSVNITAR